jgi:hypothetical protein
MWIRDFRMNDYPPTSASRPARSNNTALLDAIDHGLLALGEVVRATIYDRIEERYQVRREEIPQKLDTFHTALQELLGGGAKVVRRLIAKKLYNTLNLKFVEYENWTLVDYVQNAKAQTATREPAHTNTEPAGGRTATKTPIDLFVKSTSSGPQGVRLELA